MSDVPSIAGVEILSELGRGAYSIVWRATVDGRPCALKVPRARGRWTRWVYREAVALARVRAPELPAVLEVGEVDGLPYLAMELIEGETLAGRLRRGPLGAPETAHLGRALATALGAVHGAGLVHRDVKPQNLIFDQAGLVRLVDFGFAAPIERLSASFDAAGTPAYASPEQLRAPSRVDGRSDLFSLGRVLAECVLGALPPDDPAAAREALAAAGAPAPLAALLADLLEPLPERRPADAGAVLDRLDGLDRRGGAPAERHPWGESREALASRAAALSAVAARLGDPPPDRGGLLIVRGARGAGKTRFLQGVAGAWARRGGAAVVAECHDGDAPLAVLRRVLEGHRGRPDRQPGERDGDRAGEPPSRAAELLRAAGEDLAPLAAIIDPSLAPALGRLARGAATPPSFAEGAAELLVRIARAQGGVLLAVDGAHAADAASLDALACLAHRVRDEPVWLVLTLRAGAELPGSLARVLDLGEALDLGPLDDAEVAALAAGHLGAPRVEPPLAALLTALAQRTPAGVLELLGALLDRGALRPHRGGWALDAARAETVALPEGARALLEQRLGELPPASARVLEAAAVLGPRFEDALLAELWDLSPDDLEFALAESRRAGVVAAVAGGHRFVHASLREALLRRLGDEAARGLHRQAARLLATRPARATEQVFAAARHFAAGGVEESPRLALDCARAAAAAALARFDNEATLGLLELAARAAAVDGARPSAQDHRMAGEAHLRLGSFERSLAELRAALALDPPAGERAELLGRIAWVHQCDAQPEAAFAALELAFAALGARLPAASASTWLDTARAAARLLGRPGSRKDAPGDPRAELLCALHYQNARLGLEHDRPAHLVGSAVQAQRLAAELPDSPAKARSVALFGFVMTALGRRGAGDEALSQAERIARALGDPSTTVVVTQVRMVAASLLGQVDEALALIRRCVFDLGTWLELTELANNAVTADMILKARGAPREAWALLRPALERVARNPRAGAVVRDYVRLRADATRAELEVTERLPGEERMAVLPAERAHGMMHLANCGSRAMSLLARGELGAELDRLVASFEREGHDPRRTHIIASEYFIAVAHARVAQCLAAPAELRASRLEQLRKAAGDLRQAARIPLVEAHREVIQAWLAWLSGSARVAKAAASRAEAIAVEQRCPWVASDVARLRAHLLRAEGRAEAALDQARLAERLAREEGAEARARRIRAELGLEEPAPAGPPSSRTASSRSSRRARRQLAALLHVVRSSSADPRPDRQASAVLDELLRDLDAERAHLWFQPDPAARARLLVSRARDGHTTFELEPSREALLAAVRARGRLDATDGGIADAVPGLDPGRILSAPLSLFDRPVGAIALERGASSPEFGPHERELLDVLSQQVPLALEIARLLAEREQLQATLQQAQKMEAVGQLAGGVAHDFNNMLTAIRASLDVLAARVGEDELASAELDVVSEATHRAAHLTRQLLSFSRHRPVPAEVCDVNALLGALAPMLQRLGGARTRVRLELTPAAHAVRVDPTALEQALVNLVVNARDATPGGGEIRISTRNRELDAGHVRGGAASPGPHLEIAVSDDGHGMPPELLSRIFEPFFSTKAPGAGTGLGLTSVYAFVRNAGGHLEVESEVDRGTTFRMCLPRSEAPVAESPRPRVLTPAAPIRSPHPQDAAGKPSVLIVDDERIVSRSLGKVLERSGYRVLLAHTAEDALDVVGREREGLAVVILDMRMPGMSGPELGRRLGELEIPAKLLYISGFAPETLAEDDLLPSASFLQKPFTPADLLGRLGDLLAP